MKIIYIILASFLISYSSLKLDTISTTKLIWLNPTFNMVDSIIINGNKRTKEHIIKREILHPMNAYLDSLILNQDINRLYNLGIFSTVDINVENNIYHVNVIESFSIIPDPIIDYSEVLDKWSYGLGVSDINFLGLDQSLYFGGAFIGEKWFTLSLYNPWIYGDHISFKTLIFNRSSDNPFYNFSYREIYLSSRIGFYKGLNNKFDFNLSYYKHNIKQSTISEEFSDFIRSKPSLNYRYIDFNFNYQYDTRDIYADPLEGLLFNFNTGYSKGLTNNSPDISQISISFQNFFLLQSRYFHEPVFSYEIYTLFKFPKFEQLPIHEYEYLGGENYVKGYSSLPNDYPSKIIETSNILYNNFQLQSTIFKRRDFGKIEFGIDGLLFINSGIGSFSVSSFSVSNILIGYGFGLKFFITGGPPISVIFGFNSDGKNQIHLID